MRAPKRSLLKAGVLAVFLLGVSYLYFFTEFSFDLDPGRITGWLEGAGLFAPALYMLAMATAVVVSPIPSLPLNFAAGAFFGPLAGTLYSLTGALGGAVACFMISRFLGREVVERLLGGRVNFCDRCTDRLLTRIVFVSRLIPFISFDVVSYGAGLTKISLLKFSLATFFGMIPLTSIYNFFGPVLVFHRGLLAAGGLVVVALFFLMPRWIEKTGLSSRLLGHSHGSGKTAPDDRKA